MTSNNDVFLDRRKIAYLNSAGVDQALTGPVAHEDVSRTGFSLRC